MSEKTASLSHADSPGTLFRHAVKRERPLQVMGSINAYSALLAEKAGFSALYLSGAGVANASYGMPDLGMTTRSEVLLDAQRITSRVTVPLLIDIDTGWGDELSIERTIQECERAGVAAVHIEDQVASKRCGHRPGKQVVGTEEMVSRIAAAVSGRSNDQFVIMARTDAIAQKGLDEGIRRLQAFVEAGADMVFPEAVTDLADYQKVKDAVGVPVLANITEFGRTPLYTRDELAAHGVDLILYPLSAFRAMSKAAKTVYETIRSKGTQRELIDVMQTREELYEILGYHEYEQRVDKLQKSQYDSDKE